jgi:hypothetical protein
MLRRVALVRIDVSEELSTPFIRARRISELRRTLAVTSNRRTLRRILVTLMKEVLRSSETSVLTRSTCHNIPEGGILLFKFQKFSSHGKWVSWQNGMECPRVADGGDGLQLYRLAAKRLNKQSQTAENCGSPARRLSVALKTHSVQNKLIQNLTKIFEHGLISG